MDVAVQPAGEPAPWSILVECRSEGGDIDGIQFIQSEDKDHKGSFVDWCGLELGNVGGGLPLRNGSSSLVRMQRFLPPG